ncbi:zinc finger protein 555-like [Ostrinia nubilalis]|uniref:zinc finger protein 555-like n=1 Tax=Ostrinia nubilalis TaxID=29057 RepID=UPI003082323A
MYKVSHTRTSLHVPAVPQGAHQPRRAAAARRHARPGQHVQGEPLPARRYTCPLCRKELTSPAGLRLHVVTHGQANMYKELTSPAGLRLHVVTHGQANMYKELTSPAGLRLHVVTHGQANMYKELTSPAGLRLHVVTHGQANMYKELTSPAGLRLHVVTHGQANMYKVSHTRTSLHVPAVPQGAHQPRRAAAARRHARPGQHVQGEPLPARRYTCPLCRKQLTSPAGLRLHVVTHGQANMYKELTSPAGLRLHVVTHGQANMYKVSHYPHVATRQHVQGEPLPARRYTCPLCRKELTSPAGLRLHVVTHGQANMYKCKSCPKTYAVKRTMIRHIRKRHMPKNTSRAPREFYQKLDPRECCLPLDEEAMTKIFGPPKKKSSENVIRDFVTFTKGLKLPENPPANDGADDDDDDDDDDEDLSEEGSQDKDSEGESEVDEKTPQKTEEEAELEPTDFVSVKIEHVEEDVEEEQ